ncbi:GspH/FimT family protein [Acidobacteria bacterium AH-259-D05]|nr:GspH/FimT family protein [Acidobacteria bacterium AH-259-D05]
MSKRHQSGFSLIEVAIIAIVVAVIVGISVPQIQRSLSLYRLTGSANLVATELNAGRTLAVSRNWLYEIDCNTTNHTIQIIDPNDAANNPRTEKSLDSGITFNSIPSSGSEIRFYSRGHARSGTIVLQNEDGNTISVVVTASGMIEIQ